MGEKENVATVRRLWELFEARQRDSTGSASDENFVGHWPHTMETFRGGRKLVAMNRAFPFWDRIIIDRVVGKAI